MLGTQHGHLYVTRHVVPNQAQFWAQVLPHAHGRRSNTVQPYRSVFPGRWSYRMEQSCWKAMPQWYQPCESEYQRVNPGLPEAVTRLSNVGNQLTRWLCVAKKPSEVQHKMIFMGHQIFSCHVPVVRSFSIDFKIIPSSWNCWYDHLPKYFNITLKLPNMTFDKSKKASCNELLSTFSASKSCLVLYHKSPCFD